MKRENNVNETVHCNPQNSIIYKSFDSNLCRFHRVKCTIRSTSNVVQALQYDRNILKEAIQDLISIIQLFLKFIDSHQTISFVDDGNIEDTGSTQNIFFGTNILYMQRKSCNLLLQIYFKN